MYLNKAIIIGNLTRDPELRSLPSGVNVTTFAVATNRNYRDKDGNKQEDTQFHNIVVFGKQADNVAAYLKKGNTALVEGRLQTRSWESEGVKKYRTEIVAERVQFGPKGGAAPAGGAGQQETEGNAAGASPTGEEQASGAEGADINYPEGGDINPEDIPF